MEENMFSTFPIAEGEMNGTSKAVGIHNGANVRFTDNQLLELSGSVAAALVGNPNGVASLDADGKVPIDQLPAVSASGTLQDVLTAGNSADKNIQLILAGNLININPATAAITALDADAAVNCTMDSIGVHITNDGSNKRADYLIDKIIHQGVEYLLPSEPFGTGQKHIASQEWVIANVGGSGYTPVDFNAALPFDKDYSFMNHSINGATVFTANNTGKTPGGTVQLRLISNGVNIPDFSAFTITSGSWDNTANMVNRVVVTWNGYEYEAGISQLGIYTGPDTNPPTVSNGSAIQAHKIRVVFSEAVSTSALGWIFTIGAPLTITNVSGSGNTWDFTISETLTSASSISFSYNNTVGDTVDNSGNELQSFSNQAVTNSIPISGPVALSLTGVSPVVESPTGTWTTPDSNNIIANRRIPSGNSGRYYAKYNLDGTAICFGISPNNTPTSFSAWPYGWYQKFTPQIAALPADSVAESAPQVGDFYGIHVLDNGNGSSTITLEKSVDNGASWSVIYTYGTAIANSNWYLKAYSFSGSGGKIVNPTAENIL